MKVPEFRTKFASDSKGNILLCTDGLSSELASIEIVEKEGFAEPLTECENIYVNGVLASCSAYVQTYELKLYGVNISAHKLGRILLAPLRSYRKLQKYDFKRTKNGLHPYVHAAFWVYEKVLRQELVM